MKIIEILKQYQKYDQPINRSKFAKEYVKGQVDYYVGIRVPILRKLARLNYNKILEQDLNKLITNKIHEYRLFALFILEQRMLKAKSILEQKKVVDYYLKYIEFVNNWDLVDASAYQLLGKYLYNINDYNLLYKFSKSNSLWIKRISIVATNYLIRNNLLKVTIDIVDNLLTDKHDLIQKANGWMLRNLGDKNQKLLTNYILNNYNRMPRTTLRYSIEHYPETQRLAILKGDFSWI